MIQSRFFSHPMRNNNEKTHVTLMSLNMHVLTSEISFDTQYRLQYRDIDEFSFVYLLTRHIFIKLIR